MIISLIYILLSILGLSFLIFIHELGHYWMAKREGMRVETFSIGFGKPIASWNRNGEHWQIGWLLFGGYVKIAGLDIDKEKNPYDVPGGFFTKTPLARIKVALMGPLVNILFAVLAFTLLWSSGGREKSFSEYTSKIGWVDPESEAYAFGVRPGDEITAYDSTPFQGSKDHLYGPMTSEEYVDVKGYHVNYATQQKEPFNYHLKVYQHPSALEKGIKTAGILQSANYIIYDKLPQGRENPLPEGSPLRDSGIEYGDRLFWVDGEVLFSLQELNHLLNGNYVLITINRNGEILQRRVPRILVKELKPDVEFREELRDWQFEAELGGIKTQNLYAIPYNISNQAVVENPLKFIDKEKEQAIYSNSFFSELEKPLEAGDRIIAIYGKPITQAYELLAQLQDYKVNVIVQKNLTPSSEPVRIADQIFDQEIEWDNLQQIVKSIGTNKPIQQAGNLLLLPAISPKPRIEFNLSQDKLDLIHAETLEQKKLIESIQDPEKKNQALRLLQLQEKRLLLGLPGIQDRKVQVNPQPLTLFGNVFSEIWRTLSALVSGALSPKWIMGPIGIVQVVHDTSMSSIREALYWLGAISLNLGILNLLPIPVLDGGTILMCLAELVSGKKIHPKTMEKLVFPFAILLIGFFIFLTYNDLLRIFGNLLH